MKKKIAIPVSKDNLCSHFGESEQFAIIETDDQRIIAENYLKPPPHQPGVFPRWLADNGVTHVIAGGMGRRALELFQHFGITPIVGVDQKPVKVLIEDFMHDQLTYGVNKCNHS